MPNDDTEQMIKKVELYFKCAVVFMSTFLTLHSFADGNGRMTRLLVNYCLSVINRFGPKKSRPQYISAQKISTLLM